jgi:hypothetical protein
MRGRVVGSESSDALSLICHISLTLNTLSRSLLLGSLGIFRSFIQEWMQECPLLHMAVPDDI